MTKDAEHVSSEHYKLLPSERLGKRRKGGSVFLRELSSNYFCLQKSCSQFRLRNTIFEEFKSQYLMVL